MYNYSKERAIHRAHTRVYMHTFNSVHPNYNFEAVGMKYTFESAVPLRARCTVHIHAHTCIHT